MRTGPSIPFTGVEYQPRTGSTKPSSTGEISYLRSECDETTHTKVCFKINGDEMCSDDGNQSAFKITDDSIKFTSLQDGVSSIQMVVDNENGGIQMSNIIVLYTGTY